MANLYPYSAYDKYLCLRPSISMWASIAFLVRPYAILIMSMANRQDRTGVLNMFYGDTAALGIDSLAALPVILLLIAVAKHYPEAPAYVRWIWSHGRMLLLSSTVVNIASVFIPLLWDINTRIHIPEVLKLAICAAILVMLIKSERVKDTFADFPQPDPDEKSKRAKKRA